MRFSAISLLFTVDIALASRVGEDGTQLLQTNHRRSIDLHTIEEPSACALPAFGKWCTVRGVSHIEDFTIAVYNNGPGHTDIVSENICTHGHWDVKDMSLFGAPGHALDIGGHIGYMSLILASYGWTVDTFEPNPKNVELLRATMCKNPGLAQRISLHHMGLGYEQTTCDLFGHPRNEGDTVTVCGTVPERQQAPLGFDRQHSELKGSFEVQRLDDVLEQLGLEKIDLVKIDVETFECQVFKGGQSLLTKFRPKMIKSEVWREMTGCTAQEYLNMFKAANFTIAQSFSPEGGLHCLAEDESLTSARDNEFYICPQA